MSFRFGFFRLQRPESYTEFQRLYTPTAFREERILWRAVIQLNIVRSIRTILEALSTPYPNSPYASPHARTRSLSRPRHPPLPSNHSPPFPPQSHAIDSHYESNGNGADLQFSYGSPHMHYPPRRQEQNRDYDQDDEEYEPDSDTEFTVANQSYPNSPPNFNHGSPRSDPSASSTTTLAQTPLEALKTRLLPLRHIEALLIAKLVPPNEEEATHLGGITGNDYHNGNGHPPGSPTESHFSHHNGRLGHHRSHSHRNQEIFVRPGPGWKGGLAKARVNFQSHSYDDSSPQSSNGQRPMSAGNTGLETQDEAQEVLHSCRKDMIQLWNDEGIRDILRRRKIRLEEGSGL